MAMNITQLRRAPVGATPLRGSPRQFGGATPAPALPLGARYTEFLSRQFKASASFVFTRHDLTHRDVTNHIDLRDDADDAVQALAEGLSRHVLEMEHQLIVTDTHSHPLLAGMQPGKPPSFAGFLGVPIRSDSNAVIGVLCVADQRMRDWTDIELLFLSVIAEELGRSMVKQRRAEGLHSAASVL